MSTSATKLIGRQINVLLVENDPTHADEFKEKLGRIEKLTGKRNFKIEHFSSFKQNIKQAAETADIVVLDIHVDNSVEKSFGVAKDLLREMPHLTIIFFTAYPKEARDRLNTIQVPYTLEKNETILGSLDYLLVKIFALEKSRFLLRSVREMSQQHDQTYLEKQYKTIACELTDLNFSMGLMDRYMNARQIVEPHGYRRLHQALLPMFALDSFGRSTFSRSDLAGIVEPNLSFAEGALDVLKQIEGVIPNPDLERELGQLRHFDPAILDEVQYVKDGEPEGAIVDEEVREQPTDVVRKYTEVKFPKMCVLLEKVSLKIQFKTEAPGNIVNVPFEGSEEVSVLVYISGDGFEITENSKSVSVPRNSESDVIEFVVQPRKLGDQYLFLNFYKGIMRVGCVVVCTFVGKEEGGNE